MQKVVKEIYDYWTTGRNKYIMDTDILIKLGTTLTDAEINILHKGQEVCMSSDSLRESYLLIQNRMFYRHNDYACGYTTIDEDGTVRATADSSITELSINLSSIEECNKNQIFKIKDVDRSRFATLSLETIADVAGAMLIFNINEKDDE